jgi:CheY-like chemotaxis protein
VVQRLRPDGHTIEIRRKDLLNGGTIVVYADITGQKQGEAALREARQAADASARLVSMILAETDAPLARMTAELADIPDHALGPAARLPLTAVRQSADLVRQVLDDMADLERIRSGGPMRPGFFDIGAVIEDSVARVRHRASERGIAITAGQRGAAPTTMHADEQRLRRLLLIMLNNAISHSPPGEIAIAAEPGQAADRAARILVKRRSRAVVEAGRVHDTAVHRDAPDGWPGSELGFAICQELAGLMGGRIVGEASTTPDGVAEATIWFELPASGIQAGPAPPEGAAGASPGSPDDQTSIPGFGPMGASRRPLPRTRILLVEDVVASQIVTATLLRRDGHMVDIAGSGEAALMAAEKCPYDLVFMDISMPGMDGLTATAAIRALPEPVRAVPVIALTADVSPLDSDALDAAGMNGVLGKPIVLDELLEAVAKHVWSRGPANGQSASGSSPPPSGLVPRVGPATPLIPARPVLAAERILELRGHLPPATFVSLVEECLVDLDQRLPALRQAFATGSVSGITAHAHAMVGMAGGYGMASLEARLRAIVTAARTGDTAALGPSAVPEVEAELAAATRALRELMQDVLT